MDKKSILESGSGIINPSPLGYKIGDLIESVQWGKAQRSSLKSTKWCGMDAGQTGIITGIDGNYVEIFNCEDSNYYIRYQRVDRLNFKVIKKSNLKMESGKTAQKIKEKKVFHTFSFGEREITICVKNNGFNEVYVGYSVKVKEDKFDQNLAEKISSGRADSKNRLEKGIISNNFQTTSSFKAIAKVWERRIINNPSKHIKGLKGVIYGKLVVKNED